MDETHETTPGEKIERVVEWSRDYIKSARSCSCLDMLYTVMDPECSRK